VRTEKHPCAEKLASTMKHRGVFPLSYKKEEEEFSFINNVGFLGVSERVENPSTFGGIRWNFGGFFG
jgi:hypothetical protein